MSSSKEQAAADFPFLKPFITANSASAKEVATDFPPFVKVYKDGTVERYFASPIVLPSLDDPTTGVATKDVTISANISARIYIPAAALAVSDHPTKKLPVLVYFHGGAFCLESAFSFLDNRYLKQIVSKSGSIIVSVEYRLAPEHPLPAAYEDCWEALQWVASHANGETENPKEPWLISHGDFQKLYLGGDSAGGNLAYNTTMKAGAEELLNKVKISGVFLACPCFGDSKTKNGSDEVNRTFRLWEFVYPSAPGGINNPLINPFSDDKDAPDLAAIGCQKVMVVAAEKDVLRDINLRYAAALKGSGWGGEVEVVDVEGEDHCFHAFEPYGEKAQSVISKLAAFIKV